ncbi:hypothetical protein [Plantactinospora sp. GCM10030261]|uniref:hypothetical protein n=1 Tax=Plantactinospora sp. GCM10030261 TaxID=3273420 RepID=UPI003618F696
MRLTVGPLPPAVYWRRRAVVLGAVLLFLIVVLYSCTGQDDPKQPGAQQPGTGGSSSAPSASTGATPTSAASPGTAAGSSASPGDSGGSAPGPGSVDEVPPATGPANPTGVAAPPPGGCTDAEMSVIPVPNPDTARRGTGVALQLKIKNISGRTCPRDVGSDLQEIYIKLGAQKVWSSDTCSTARQSNVVQFPPSHEQTYQVEWNGRDDSRCADGVATGPFPNAGDYQVIGRLGSKLSEPVKLSIVN